MKTCKYVITRLLAVTLVALMVIGLGSSAYARDEKGNQFDVDVTYGLDGLSKTGAAMPVNVSVTNKGSDFQGTVRVILSSGNESNVDNIAYDKDMIIAAGTIKDISMTVQGATYMTSFIIEILDEKGDVCYKDKVLCNTVTTGSYSVLGIITDDYSGLNYFDGVSYERGYYYGSLKIAELTEENLPDSKEALAVCNYILINNYDTSKLSDAQIDAMKQWVSEGGVLIFGTGPNSQKVFSKFNDNFVTGTIGDMSKEDINIPDSAEDNSINVDTVDISVDDANSLTTVTTSDSFVEKTVGKGSVVVANFDFGLEPVKSWKSNKAMVANLFAAAGTETTTAILQNENTIGSSFNYSTENAVNTIPENKRPSAILYGIVFLIYIVCIGPILYIILKAMNKRELLWIMIPVLSIVFTVIVFATSLMYRVWHPFVGTVTVLDYEDGAVSTSVYGSIQSPDTGKYDVTFCDGYNGYVPYSQDNYYINSNGSTTMTDLYAYAIKEDNNKIILNMNKGRAFASRYFTLNGGVESDGSDINLDIEYSINSFTGNITNNTGYDLTDVVIIYKGMCYIVGDMAAGTKISVETKDFSSYGYSYNIVNSLYDNKQGFSELSSGEYSRNQNLIDMMCNNYYDCGGVEGVIFGKITNYQQDLIENKSVKEYNRAFVVKTFNSDLSEIADTIYENILRDCAIDSSAQYDVEDGWMYSDDMTVTYFFDKSIDKLVLIDINSDITSADEYAYTTIFADVSAYNEETGNYDSIFENGETEVDDLTPYLSEANTITLRFKSGVDIGNGYSTENRMPVISAIGGER